MNNKEAFEKDLHTESDLNNDSGIFCLPIIGQIEGHYALEAGQKSTKYDHVLPLLLELEESKKVKGIVILINTLGGDVEAGLAIAEMIASLTKPTASIVLGGGHSIGVPLAVSANKSFIGRIAEFQHINFAVTVNSIIYSTPFFADRNRLTPCFTVIVA